MGSTVKAAIPSPISWGSAAMLWGSPGVPLCHQILVAYKKLLHRSVCICLTLPGFCNVQKILGLPLKYNGGHQIQIPYLPTRFCLLLLCLICPQSPYRSKCQCSLNPTLDSKPGVNMVLLNSTSQRRLLPTHLTSPRQQ